MTNFRLRSGSALVVAATLIAAVPAGAQTAASDAVAAPAVSALQNPAERVGEYAEVNGARIFYEAAGDGPPMLLLHGYPLSGALFARMRDRLQEDYTVITLDHRGYGQSEAPGTPDSIGTYADDALAVLDQLGIDQAIIGGMSMGGPIVFDMYRKAPERFSGLILIDTIAAPASPAEAGLWRGMADMIREDGVQAIIPALLPDMLTGQTRSDRPEVVDYLTRMMEGTSDEAAIGGAIALADRPDAEDLLARIDVPTLVLVGLADPVYSVEISRQMQEQIANSTLSVVPDASHAAVFEAPEAAAEAIADWAEAF